MTSAGGDGGGADLGGDAACWSHLDLAGGSDQATVVDLSSVSTDGLSGAVWSLPHGGDLDSNLVCLQADASILDHVNDEVDVLMIVRSGRGQLFVDGRIHQLAADVLALIPRGAHRSVVAQASGLRYLSVHRRRSALGISGRPGSTADEVAP